MISRLHVKYHDGDSEDYISPHNYEEKDGYLNIYYFKDDGADETRKYHIPISSIKYWCEED